MDINDYLKGEGGMVNSQAVQEHLLQQLVRNSGQLNFRNRAALLEHLQGLQKNEMETAKPAPISKTFPFVDVIDNGE
ncbi:MAG: hypothetical protein WC886_06285 [Saccharofermentanaceae bacterium]|jgi:hypothetical protein